MQYEVMSKRFAVIATIAGVSALGLCGCQKDALFPPTPYYGINHAGKHFVPRELHEEYVVDPSIPPCHPAGPPRGLAR